MAREKRPSTSKQITYNDDDMDPSEGEQEGVPVASTSKGKGRARKSRKVDSDTEDDASAQAVTKAKRATGRQRLGKLSAFNNMPLDVLSEICSHLEPISLLYMSRTTKNIRQLLTSKGSRSLWICARHSVALPDLAAEDVSEPSYASLVYERNCMALKCSPFTLTSTTGQRFQDRPRDGLLAGYFFTPAVQIISDKLHNLEAEHNSIVAAFEGSKATKSNKGKGKAKQVANSEDDQDTDSPSDETPYERFIIVKKDAVSKSREDGALIWKWENTSTRDRHAASAEASARREDAIDAKMVALGWDPLDLQNIWTTSYSTPKDLTDRIWNKIKAEIIDAATSNKTYRLQDEAQSRRSQRQRLIDIRHTALLAEIERGPNFPSKTQFYHFPSVKPLWDPEDASVDDASWSAALPSILLETAAFEKETKRKYFAHLAFNLHKVGIPLDTSLVTINLDLSTTRYTYDTLDAVQINDSLTDEAMDEVFARFSSVFGCRQCRVMLSYDDMIIHRRDRHASTGPDTHYAEDEIKVIKRRLERLAKEGLEETISDSVLDDAGEVYECHGCSATGASYRQRMMVQVPTVSVRAQELTWTGVQQHYLTHHVWNNAYYTPSKPDDKIIIKKMTEDSPIELKGVDVVQELASTEWVKATTSAMEE